MELIILISFYQRRSAGSPRRHASNASIEHHKLIESIRAMQSGSPASCSSMEVVSLLNLNGSSDCRFCEWNR